MSRIDAVLKTIGAESKDLTPLEYLEFLHEISEEVAILEDAANQDLRPK